MWSSRARERRLQMEAAEKERVRQGLATLQGRLTIEAAKRANAAFLKSVPGEPVSAAFMADDFAQRLSLQASRPRPATAPAPTGMMSDEDYVRGYQANAADRMPYTWKEEANEPRRRGTQGSGENCATVAVLTAFRFSPIWDELITYPNQTDAADGPGLLLALMTDQFLRRKQLRELSRTFDSASHDLVFRAAANLSHLMNYRTQPDFVGSAYCQWFTTLGYTRKIKGVRGRPPSSTIVPTYMNDFYTLVNLIITAYKDRPNTPEGRTVTDKLTDGSTQAVIDLVTIMLDEMSRMRGRPPSAAINTVFPDEVQVEMAQGILNVMGPQGTSLTQRKRYLQTLKGQLLWHQTHALAQGQKVDPEQIEQMSCAPLTGCLERLIKQIGPTTDPELLATQRALAELLNRMRPDWFRDYGDIRPMLLANWTDADRDDEVAAAMYEVGKGYLGTPNYAESATDPQGPLTTTQALNHFLEGDIRLRQGEGGGRAARGSETAGRITRYPGTTVRDPQSGRAYGKRVKDPVTGQVLDQAAYNKFYDDRENPERMKRVTFEEEIDAAVDCYFAALILIAAAPMQVHFELGVKSTDMLLSVLMTQVKAAKLYALVHQPRPPDQEVVQWFPPMQIPSPDVRGWVNEAYDELPEFKQRALVHQEVEPYKNYTNQTPADFDALIARADPGNSVRYHTHMRLAMILVNIAPRIKKLNDLKATKAGGTPGHRMAVSFPRSAAKAWPIDQWRAWMAQTDARNQKQAVGYQRPSTRGPDFPPQQHAFEVSSWGMPLLGTEARAMSGAADALPSLTQCTLLDSNWSTGMPMQEVFDFYGGDPRKHGWAQQLFGPDASRMRYDALQKKWTDEAERVQQAGEWRTPQDGRGKWWLRGVSLVWITTNVFREMDEDARVDEIEDRLTRAEEVRRATAAAQARLAQQQQQQQQAGPSNLDGGDGGDEPDPFGPDPPMNDPPSPPQPAAAPLQPPAYQARSKEEQVEDIEDTIRSGEMLGLGQLQHGPPPEQGYEPFQTIPTGLTEPQWWRILDAGLKPPGRLAALAVNVKTTISGFDMVLHRIAERVFTRESVLIALAVDNYVPQLDFNPANGTGNLLNAIRAEDCCVGHLWMRATDPQPGVTADPNQERVNKDVQDHMREVNQYKSAYLTQIADPMVQELALRSGWFEIHPRSLQNAQEFMAGREDWTRTAIAGTRQVMQDTTDRRQRDLLALRLEALEGSEFNPDRQDPGPTIVGPPGLVPPVVPVAPPQRRARGRAQLPPPRVQPRRVAQGALSAPRIIKTLERGELLALGKQESFSWPSESFMSLPEGMSMLQWSEILDVGMVNPGNLVALIATGSKLGPRATQAQRSELYTMIARRLPQSNLIALNVGEFLDVSDEAFDYMIEQVKNSSVTHLYFEEPRATARARRKREIIDWMREVNAYKPSYLRQLAKPDVYRLKGVNAFYDWNKSRVLPQRAKNYADNPSKYVDDYIEAARKEVISAVQPKKSFLRVRLATLRATDEAREAANPELTAEELADNKSLQTRRA